MDNIIVVAVKGVIVYKNKVLIIKRSSLDKTGANTWEFAGNYHSENALKNGSFAVAPLLVNKRF